MTSGRGMTFTSVKTIETLANVGWAKVKSKLASKISLWRGDITKLEIDAIVNAANSSLGGGGGVDGAIHRAAGPQLAEECFNRYGRCATGDAVITSACDMANVKNIIHTVGPQVYRGLNADLEAKLISCYRKCLEVALLNGIKTIAFPCISTGVYGYPNADACKTAIGTVKDFLKDESNYGKIDRIVFCVFLEKDYDLYKENLPVIIGNAV